MIAEVIPWLCDLWQCWYICLVMHNEDEMELITENLDIPMVVKL